MKHFLPLLLLTGCTITPIPVAPPEDVGGTCETARANIERLGGCDQDMATFADDCAEKVELYESVGDRFPVGCLTVSKSCAKAEACK